MKQATTIVPVVIDIFILFIAITIFNVAETHFQKIVLALLIFIMININVFVGMYVRNTNRTMLALHEHLLKMRRERGNASASQEDQYVSLLKEKLQKNQIQYYIDLAFSFVILLVATSVILTNL